MNHEEVAESVFHGFYRDPDPQAFLIAVRHAVALGEQSNSNTRFILARIPQVYDDARVALSALQAEEGALASFAIELMSPQVVETLPRPLELPCDRPEVLDLLWSEFAVTGNTEAVQRILSVLDREDLVRRKLSEWLQTNIGDTSARSELKAYRDRFVVWLFPIDYTTGEIDGPVDLDLQVALLAKNGQLKFVDLPFELAGDELLSLAMKSAAVWSLRSYASWDTLVAKICAKAAVSAGGAGRLLLVG